MKYNKGQITAGVASLIMTGSLVASALTAYFTSQLSVQDKINTIQITDTTKIATVSAAVDVNVAEVANLKPRVERIENKIDALLERNGLNPGIYNRQIGLAATSSLP